MECQTLIAGPWGQGVYRDRAGPKGLPVHLAETVSRVSMGFLEGLGSLDLLEQTTRVLGREESKEPQGRRGLVAPLEPLAKTVWWVPRAGLAGLDPQGQWAQLGILAPGGSRGLEAFLVPQARLDSLA
jgi:hypothetical protein